MVQCDRRESTGSLRQSKVRGVVLLLLEDAGGCCGGGFGCGALGNCWCCGRGGGWGEGGVEKVQRCRSVSKTLCVGREEERKFAKNAGSRWLGTKVDVKNIGVGGSIKYDHRKKGV